MRERNQSSNQASASILLPPDWVSAYRKHLRFWVNLARSLSLSEDDAQDVVHAVIASALTLDRGRFESDEHIRNYVARGVLNRSFQLHQRGGRCTEFTERVDSMYAGRVEEPNNDEQLLRSVLGMGLRALPKKDFEILKLRYYGGFTFQEISALLHLPVSTLKSREDSATKKLQRWFRKRRLLDE